MRQATALDRSRQGAGAMTKPRFTHDGWDARSYELGEARARRRVRRAQREALAMLLRTHGDVDHIARNVKALDAATRTPRKGKR